MTAFHYSAIRQNGKKNQGVIEGDSEKQVRRELKSQGLIPLDVKPIVQKEKFSSHAKIKKINAAELSLITRQLATLIEAAIPVEEALETVAKQSKQQNSKKLLISIRSNILQGHTLADSLQDFSNIFNPLYTSTVAAGEQSGRLDKVLIKLADYTENRQKLQSNMGLALIYPIILTVVSILVVIGLLTYVVPQVTNVFQQLNQQLPLLTRLLIACSDFLQHYGIYLLLTLICVYFIFKQFYRNFSVKRKVHYFLLRLPLLSNFIKRMETTRFAQTLGILTSSGVPLLGAITTSTQVIENIIIKEKVKGVEENIREGASLFSALDNTELFPAMMLHMINSGECSGKLDEMLVKSAIYQEHELKVMTDTMVRLFEPALILIMGSVVLVIVLAILLPIFEINQLVK